MNQKTKNIARKAFNEVLSGLITYTNRSRTTLLEFNYEESDEYNELSIYGKIYIRGEWNSRFHNSEIVIELVSNNDDKPKFFIECILSGLKDEEDEEDYIECNGFEALEEILSGKTYYVPVEVKKYFMNNVGLFSDSRY